MRHHLVVDVSGRMEKRENKDAALAFSNDIEAAVLVPGHVKIAVNEALSSRGVPRKRCGVRVLVAGLYLLLEDFLDQLNTVVIDDELPGWGNEIKRELLGLIRQRVPHFDKSRLAVRNIGEGTRADQLAWLTRRRKQPPHRRITVAQMLAVIARIQ